jgi:hypothetical protein
VNHWLPGMLGSLECREIHALEARTRVGCTGRGKLEPDEFSCRRYPRFLTHCMPYEYVSGLQHGVHRKLSGHASLFHL